MNIFVGAASRGTNVEEYNKLAQDIANFIVEGKHTYVFGGCDSGLMGKIYTIVKNSESKIIAASVEAYKDKVMSLAEKNPEVSTTISPTVNERKNELIKASDVIIIIPGGIGTFDEMFSVIESKRAGEHNHPIFIVNVNGYYDYLLKMLDKMYDEMFASELNREVYKICNSFEELKRELQKINPKEEK